MGAPAKIKEKQIRLAETILKAWIQNRQPLHLEGLAEYSGLSRASTWKIIKKLQNHNLLVGKRPGKGTAYGLLADSGKLAGYYFTDEFDPQLLADMFDISPEELKEIMDKFRELKSISEELKQELGYPKLK